MFQQLWLFLTTDITYLTMYHAVHKINNGTKRNKMITQGPVIGEARSMHHSQSLLIVLHRMYENGVKKIRYTEEVISQFSSTKLIFVLSPNKFQCKHH
jgi:hypothetical protein